jgi:GntR family transcriptional regulator of arabinose operon
VPILDRNNPIPIYQQLASVIRNQILSGELKPGDQLLSELDMVSHYQVSRDSIRRALDLLARAGMVKRVQGKGNFVYQWQETQDEGGMISFLVPDERIFLFMNMLNGVVSAARLRGYSTVFSYLGKNEREEAETIGQQKTQGVSGFIIFPKNDLDYDAAIWQLFQEGTPFVLVDRDFPDLPCPFVGIDNVQAAYNAVSYLLRRGYSTIGFATSSDFKTSTIRDRFSGYRKALDDHGIEFRPEWLIQSPSHFSSPIYYEEQEAIEIEHYRKLIRSPQCPSAIFAINDVTAYLIARAASLVGLRIPEDLALLGFDNDDFARRSSVPLTTVAQPFEEIGARAAHLLIDRLRGSPAGFERILLPTQLIIRQSCGEGLVHSRLFRSDDVNERR